NSSPELLDLPVSSGDPANVDLSPAKPARASRTASSHPPNAGEMVDALPYFHSALDRASDAARAAHGCGGGWKHPRDSHAASQMRVRSAVPSASPESSAARGTHSAPSPGPAPSTDPAHSTALRTLHSARHSALRTQHSALAEIQTLLDTLHRWGITTCGALAALPAGDVYERLGARGVLWQRLARGEDTSPLVPWVPEDPFEGLLDLEWPIEGLEPLSFVLGRLLEPLADRLERADRGVAVLHTHLRLVSKEVYARTLQLPAPMRDPKTLRTLMLLDLESNPPSAAIDRVRVLVEPTPARVTQWRLFERAQPSPEQVSTLLARLTALMGEAHVGSPRLVDSWKPGAFAMEPFRVRSAECGVRSAVLSAECEVPVPGAGCGVSGQSAESGVPGQNAESAVHGVLAHGTPRTVDLARGTTHPHSAPRTTPRTSHSAPDSALGTPHSVLRRFRLPVPARVQVHDGRPVRVMTDRRGVTGGAVVQAAGPWRTSGEWWNDPTYPSHSTRWDRDEWDIAIADGTVYRIFVERDVGQWFVEGIVD
ncbi:MAG: hypothetical protein ACRD1H_11365, partial [Vicinamibacterales bacterium]